MTKFNKPTEAQNSDEQKQSTGVGVPAAKVNTTPKSPSTAEQGIFRDPPRKKDFLTTYLYGNPKYSSPKFKP